MGIRFSCHGCAKPLNIKNDLAGRRGVCPECKTRFRIPLKDAEFSSPLEPAEPVTQGPSADAGVPQDEPRESARQPIVVRQDGGGQASGAAVSSQATMESSPTQATATQTGSPATAQSPGVAIDLFAGDPAATWYVRPPSGGQYGPANAEVLKVWISEGRVAKTALIWRDGWPQWREASEALSEMADSLPGAVAAESDDPFSEGPSPLPEGPSPLPEGHRASKLTTPVALQKTGKLSSDLSGDAKIGAARRKRTSRRVTLVAVLATLVVGLIATLALVASTGG